MANSSQLTLLVDSSGGTLEQDRPGYFKSHVVVNPNVSILSKAYKLRERCKGTLPRWSTKDYAAVTTVREQIPPIWYQGRRGGFKICDWRLILPGQPTRIRIHY